MRLLWEQTGLCHAETCFIRHGQPFLRDALERCMREPLNWMLLPQCQWDGELYHYAKVMLADHRQSHADAKDWRLLDSPRDHPAILAWLEQRLLHLGGKNVPGKPSGFNPPNSRRRRLPPSCGPAMPGRR